MSTETDQNESAKIPPILAHPIFLAVHAWAFVMLWNHAPAGRQFLLVGAYALILVASALTMKRVIPPLLPSLIPFAVVLIWRLFFVSA